MAPRERRPEQADVRVQRPEEPPQTRLGGRPDAGRDRRRPPQRARRCSRLAPPRSCLLFVHDPGHRRPLHPRPARPRPPGADRRRRSAERVVPLFVLDDAVLAAFGAPNRVAFLLDSLARSRRVAAGAGRGWSSGAATSSAETVRIAQHTGAGGLRRARTSAPTRRSASGVCAQRSRGAGIELDVFPGITVVPPGELAPAGGDHFRVFTPYWRRWRKQPRRACCRRRRGSRSRRSGPDLAALAELKRGTPAPSCRRAARPPGARRLEHWLDDGLARYGGARRRPRRRRHLAPVALPPLRLCLRRRGRRPRARARRRGAVRPAALLARLQPPAARGAAAARARGSATARRRLARRRRARSRRGARGAPATRSSTPACASCCGRASCTTARGSSPARS